MTTHDVDSWAGSIVRGRDGRKGRVLQDDRPLFGGRSILTVHWENDSTEQHDRHTLTMLRPPIGYRVPAARHGGARPRNRAPWLLIASVVVGLAVAVLATYAGLSALLGAL